MESSRKPEVVPDGLVTVATTRRPNQFGSPPVNYSEFENDGTLKFVGDAVVFNDINMSGQALGPGATPPAVVNIAGSTIRAYAFIGTGGTQDELHGSCEILHDYLEGSDIVPHVHWSPTTAGAGDVKWQLSYIWINRGGTAGASTVISVVTAAGGTAWVGHISSFPAISGAGMEIGSRFMYRIFRDPADAADTYGADAVLYDIGIHYQADTVGSRTVTAK